MITPLSALQLNDTATIIGFAADCPRAYRRRLLTMGLLPQTNVHLLRVAPLGDPVELKVRGSHLTLRKSEAQHILVEVLS